MLHNNKCYATLLEIGQDVQRGQAEDGAYADDDDSGPGGEDCDVRAVPAHRDDEGALCGGDGDVARGTGRGVGYLCWVSNGQNGDSEMRTADEDVGAGEGAGGLYVGLDEVVEHAGLGVDEGGDGGGAAEALGVVVARGEEARGLGEVAGALRKGQKYSAGQEGTYGSGDWARRDIQNLQGGHSDIVKGHGELGQSCNI